MNLHIVLSRIRLMPTYKEPPSARARIARLGKPVIDPRGRQFKTMRAAAVEWGFTYDRLRIEMQKPGSKWKLGTPRAAPGPVLTPTL